MIKNKIIDPHIHLFDLIQGEYHWLKKENPPFWPDKNIISQNFNEQDLLLKNDLELAGFVHIEAGFDNEKPWREIQWLEESCNILFKSIAYIDITLTDKLFIKELAQLKEFNSLIGCRYILDEHAPQLLSSNTVQGNLALLANEKLLFEVQMLLEDTKSIDALVVLLTTSPTLKIVLNHSGSPTPENINQWQLGIQTLSQFSQCVIKCSGWEMTNRDYNSHWQQQIIKICIDNFGYQRVMLASNFPLCLFNKNSYQVYWQSLLALPIIEQLNETKKSALLYGNALHCYQLTE